MFHQQLQTDCITSQDLSVYQRGFLFACFTELACGVDIEFGDPSDGNLCYLLFSMNKCKSL